MEYISLCKQSDLYDCNIILVANVVQIPDAQNCIILFIANTRLLTHLLIFGLHNSLVFINCFPVFSQFSILSGTAMTSLLVLFFVFVTRMTTHDYGHVRMVDDVIANGPSKGPPEFPQPTAAADDDVSVFFFGSGNHHLPWVTYARSHRSS